MKKIAIMALLVMASAGFNTANAQSKKQKKQKKQEAREVITAVNPVGDEGKIETMRFDSLSYAAGVSMTRGLEDYLSSQLGVSKEQLPDFMRGLKEGFSKRKDASFSAYTAGLQIAAQVERNMLPNMKKQFKGTSADINDKFFFEGFIAAMEKDTTFLKQEEAQEYLNKKQKALTEHRNAQTKAAGEKFLAENKKKQGVVTLPSGLQYKILVKGEGEKPTKDDQVIVVYEGRTIDGKVFDATARHGKPNDTFGVSNLIKGWTEALTLMPVGSKWEIYIPQELAYGARGAGDDIAPYSALIFTLELQGISGKEEKIPAGKFPLLKEKKK
ncbi:FKBP-type peptidyl-prolyl cis-trans isomerase [Prevotella falsenii]|uniref:FKBP-type peptidyl-prolyl cis-trans isomerase n=1 Tax=Prevotella falsenii TaxID=515414 RepID=UPI00046ABC46|nr:FKBP-type peptidyl-prolyl cis-trans isomerase [Prevotella falsenii]